MFGDGMEEHKYKEQVLQFLKERNALQGSFKDMIKRRIRYPVLTSGLQYYLNLIDNALILSEKTLYEQKLSLEAQNIALTHRNRELEAKLAQGGGGPASKEMEEQLKAKQQELNDCYKLRSESTRQILDLTQRINEMEKELVAAKAEVNSAKEALEQERVQSKSVLQGQEEREVTVTVLKQELLQLQVCTFLHTKD